MTALINRAKRLQAKRPAMHKNGRVLLDFEYPDDNSFEEALLQHERDYPDHEGIRGIKYGGFLREAIHGNE